MLGIAHAFLLRPRAGQTPLPASVIVAAVAASTAAAVAAAVGWQLAVRADAAVFTLLVGPVVAVAVAVLLDRVPARWGGLVAARITAAAVAALSLTAALVIWGFLPRRPSSVGGPHGRPTRSRRPPGRSTARSSRRSPAC